ncbi:MAG: DUF1214 domain-containing protein [Betaproteobacteria bacterium]|nr:DUF1214 domain-containing protein [Betaproteobacteria bacterium]
MFFSLSRIWLAYAVCIALLFLFVSVSAAGVEAGADPERLQRPAQSEKLQSLSGRQEDSPKEAAASTSKQEAEKQQKAEQERKDRERRAERETAAAARQEAVQAKREAEKLQKEEQERKERERRAEQEAAAASRQEAVQAKREAEKLHKKEQGRGNREGSASKVEVMVEGENAAGSRETQKSPVTATPEQIKELAYKAGLYAYPLVLADSVRQADTQAAREARGVDLSRQFFHSDEIPDAKRAPGILPRADSLYSLAWLELKNSPYLLEIPAMPGRHYLIQILDAWTRNLPAITARDTGGKSGKYILLLRGEQVPADYVAEYTPVFCPTSLCMLLARIQVKEQEDISAARGVQQALRLTPLFPDKLAGQAIHSGAAPVQQLAVLDAEEFLSRFTALLADNPAPDRDARMVGQLVHLGVAQGEKTFFSLEEPLRGAAVEGCRQALSSMGIYFNSMSAYNDPMDVGINGWNISVMDVGTYGERYDMRSRLAAADFGALRSQDMLQATLRVDAEGKFLDGERNYVLRFEPGQLPPVEGFWSLTLYTAKQQLNDNKMRRYALTSSSKLVSEPDGSIVMYFQPKAPDKKYQANWLPTPTLGYFSLVLRLYAPKPRALNADWRPPKIMPEKNKTAAK